jgi:hypothetical protein
MGQSFDEPDQFVMAVREICESSENAVLEVVFHEWRETLAKCLVVGGGLVENTQKSA